MWIEAFAESCKKESLEIFKSHSGKDSLDFVSLEQSNEGKQKLWSSFIFLGGTKFRCMFTVRFSTIALLSLASDRFSDVNESEYISNVKDFMREYCNLFAGKLKACFETETDAYLSLPIMSREYDLETLFDVPIDKVDKEVWSIGENKMKIDINFFYYEKEPFVSYDFINNHLESEETNDNIDFF